MVSAVAQFCALSCSHAALSSVSVAATLSTKSGLRKWVCTVGCGAVHRLTAMCRRQNHHDGVSSGTILCTFVQPRCAEQCIRCCNVVHKERSAKVGLHSRLRCGASPHSDVSETEPSRWCQQWHNFVHFRAATLR